MHTVYVNFYGLLSVVEAADRIEDAYRESLHGDVRNLAVGISGEVPFTDPLAPAYGLGWTGEGFIIGLPGRPDWRTYLATDEDGPIAAAATMTHESRPQLGFAGTRPTCRRKGAHMGLLHRQIEDASASGAEELFAITDEEPGFPDVISPGARNLLRAGFRLVERPLHLATAGGADRPRRRGRRGRRLGRGRLARRAGEARRGGSRARRAERAGAPGLRPAAAEGHGPGSSRWSPL